MLMNYRTRARDHRPVDRKEQNVTRNNRVTCVSLDEEVVKEGDEEEDGEGEKVGATEASSMLTVAVKESGEKEEGTGGEEEELKSSFASEGVAS
jgi:hypothetical protein